MSKQKVGFKFPISLSSEEEGRSVGSRRKLSSSSLEDRVGGLALEQRRLWGGSMGTEVPVAEEEVSGNLSIFIDYEKLASKEG